MSATSIKLNPTAYQSEIYNTVIELENKSIDQNALIIAATAGSGKTTTLLETVKLINPDKRTLVVAFNKHIVKEIESKLQREGVKGQIAVKTVHSLGYGCLAKIKKPNTSDSKYKDLISAFFEGEAKKPFDVINSIAQVLHFVQVSLNSELSFNELREEVKHLNSSEVIDLLTEMPVLEEIIDFYNIEIDSEKISLTEVQTIVNESLKKGLLQFKQKGLIDYNDMLFIPFILNLSPLKYDVVLGDECQDWSRSMLNLILKAQSNQGYSIFVGDPYQSINGFAGSNPFSFEEIKQSTNHVLKPLSTCFRCGKNIIRYAQTVNPEIQHHDTAIDGKVEQISLERLVESIQSDDLILCRLTAPLIGLCIKLIGMKIKANVIGRNIGQNLTTTVKKVDDFAKKTAKKNGEFYEWSNFLDYLEQYKNKEFDKIKKQKNAETKLQSLIDKCDGIVACYEGFDSDSIGSFCLEINNLFTEEQKGVTLSTVHRAKGLESDRVFIISPEKLPLRWKGMKEWEVEQERNIQFVAYTRAKKEMFFVK